MISMKNLTRKLFQSGAALGAALLPRMTFAATLYNPLGTASVPEIIGRVVQIVLGVSGSLALIMFVYGGLIWLTSNGDSGKIDKGKKTLIWSVIGIGVIFSAFALATFVVDSLGRVATT
jgi:fumarate reductase subunit D